MYSPPSPDETAGVGGVFLTLVFYISIPTRCATYPSSHSHCAYVLNKVVDYCMCHTAVSIVMLNSKLLIVSRVACGLTHEYHSLPPVTSWLVVPLLRDPQDMRVSPVPVPV